MHWRRQFSVLFFFAATPLANFTTPLVPPWDDLHVKHTWIDVPQNWETLGSPSSNTTIDLHIALVPQYENALIDALYEVSTPGHPKYGEHLPKEQVAQLVAPHPETLQLINSWLEHHGILPSAVSVTHGGGWLTITGVPVSRANEMLGASYQLFRPSGTNGTTILRTIGYALPAVLHKHVRTVVPTTCFASNLPLQQTSRRRSVGATAEMGSREPGTVLSSRNDDEDEDEYDTVEPSDLRALYRTAAYVPAATDKNSIGIAGFSNNFPSPADLAEFMSDCREDAIDAIYAIEQINGGRYEPTNPTSEANQNIQYSQAMAYPTPHTFYSTGGNLVIDETGEPAGNDVFLAWINHLISLDKIPQTISAAYGKYENVFPVEYTKAICDLFAHFGTRGVSVLFASGNEGDGSGRIMFVPEFPSSCMCIILFLLKDTARSRRTIHSPYCHGFAGPYVTSVGGTVGEDPEEAALISGGGFSNHFPRPPYQTPAVPTFLERFGNHYYNGLYNPDGRGIPDVAAQALKYFVIERDKGTNVDGTSCATSTVGGIFSLLNDYLISKGKQPLGWLNPWLYGLGVVGMNDIKSGSNPGCGTRGFPAIPGWDPVTGLGTPDFVNLQAVIDYMIQFSPPPQP
ncbi:subtilisin-like protein [Lactarius quietus]|nr:subtilisin-like protein [Lactarius quietus]